MGRSEDDCILEGRKGQRERERERERGGERERERERIMKHTHKEQFLLKDHR